MSTLRLKVELNKGRRGIPMRKLSDITKETVKFLSMVCVDIGANKSSEEWLAVNFENNSVDFDCEVATPMEEQTIENGRGVLRAIMGNAMPSPEISFLVRPETRIQYSRIASFIDPDETIGFGLYRNGESKPEEWYKLDKSAADQISSENPSTANYYGEIQGIVHALYKETDKPKLVVRELSTRNLIDCFFKPDMYQAAVEVLQDKDTVLFVEGIVTENMANGIVESIEVNSFTPAPLFDEKEMRAFYGTKPDLTGDLTTEDYIHQNRANAETIT